MASSKDKTPYPHSFMMGEYGIGNDAKTSDELDIIRLSADIREKPDWVVKIQDPEIISKWSQEIGNQMNRSELKLKYVLDELSYYLSLKDGSIEPGAISGTWISDALIETGVRDQLLNSISILEDVPEVVKDWHPGSNGQVLDLIHPSLFCFVAERSRVLKKESCQSTSQGPLAINFPSEENFLSQEEVNEIAFTHTNNFPDFCKSKKFQWLPSEFSIGEDNSVQINSYINNLHPEVHSELYTIIGKIFEKFIPLFNKVLTDLRNPKPNRLAVAEYGNWYEAGVEIDDPNRIPNDVDIPEFCAPEPPKSIVNLAGSNLQVIVKLASIHLTPEKPEYPGGTWHVEGMVNERIVASGIYYYSSDNLTESRLLFRQAIKEPDYEQYDDVGVRTVYGLTNEQALNQNLGSIITKEGRCIAFPNTLQHCVAPFQLEDSTRNGHRKILVFFLVDPNVKILSTARVPPQQTSWFTQEVVQEPGVLPEEMVKKIVGMMDWPMSLDEAKKHREELMNERKFFVKGCNDDLFERPFYMCEH